MARALTSTITSQLTKQSINRTHIFRVNNVDYTSYLKSWSASSDKSFGSNSAVFVLINDGRFSKGGASAIKVGDQVELVEQFSGDSIEWKRFFGEVKQKSITKIANDRAIILNCFDYIATLKNWDLDLDSEGTKVEIINENLVPNFLPAPNDMFAQVFNFRNNSISTDPPPILMIRDRVSLTEDIQFDGFDILHDVGQVVFGHPINARDNHDVTARSYFFYITGKNVEDILEEILTQADGYGKFLFGEASAQDVIDNHLKTTFQDEEGGVLDFLTPNATSSTITIQHTVTNAISAGASSIVLDSIDGLPSSGTATINGDTFTWTDIVAHTKTLTGIPNDASGNELKEHPANSILKFSATYPAGQVWYLKYSNVTSTLTSSNFTIGSSGVFSYFDARNGRIILQEPITVAATIRCDYNYEFKTLQTAGILLNKIIFRSREVESRFHALSKVRQYVAPNYIIRTQGDNKIWASYLSQKTTADYTLDLVQNFNYLEDDDLYTRVKFFAKNKSPTNAMFADNVDFVETGQSFKSLATNNQLTFEKTEGSHQIFKTLISDAGYIVSDFFTPVVRIDGIPIDNQLHQMIQLPVTVELKTRTETTTESSKWGGTDVDVRTYSYYKIKFAHQTIHPDQAITLYNANGVDTLTISPNDGNMDYGRGIYNVPGNQENSTVAAISSATYWVRYASNSLSIDYDNVKFKINSDILPNPQASSVTADYEYYTVFTPQRGVGAIIDGRFDTQVQTEFFSDPPTGYPYAILDLGQNRTIQALDIVAGFYRPDEIRKFDIDVRFSLQSSTDNITYREISDATNNFRLTGGESVSFEEEDLGVGFQTRYIKILLEKVQKVEFKNGVFPVAINEVSVYENIVISSTASLIGTSDVTTAFTAVDNTIEVTSTANFTEPSSGETETAYIGTEGDSFTYTGLTSTSFLGCAIDSGASANIGDYIYQSLETDTTLKDDDDLLTQLGDRIFKKNLVDDESLFTQSQLDDLSKSWLKEFYKEHDKLSVSVLYAPYLKMGQTVEVTDSYNNISAVRYFIEKISESNGQYNLTLARFP